MKLFLNSEEFIDTNNPIDLSIEISNQPNGVKAWYVNSPVFEPVRANGYVGSVVEGGAVNFRNVFFNPHGNGTHTECLGHITPTVHSVNATLKEFFFSAKLISIEPVVRELEDGSFDAVVTGAQLSEAIGEKKIEAIVIRTLPNSLAKKNIDYSNTNPPFLTLDCLPVLNQAGVKHLLIDLPSVDKEEDDGVLAFHHAFWEVPANPQFDKTITELIFVDNAIADGDYLLELQMASFANDASPSRPVLYKIQKG